MATTSTAPAAPAQRQSSPPLLLPALAFAALMVISVVLARSTPLPTADAAETLEYYRDHETAARISGCLQFTGAVPLAVWSALIYQRLRRLGVTAPGPVIALTGGTLAAAFMALCGLTVWVAARSGDLADETLTRSLADLTFATGGPGHVVTFGMLLAGVSVTMLMLGIGPRAFAWTGLVLAVIAGLGILALIDTDLGVPLPIGRFGGLIWLIAASVMLPRQRERRTPAGTARAAAD